MERIPALTNTQAFEYMTTDLGDQTGIVSTASIKGSGASRTVHLDFNRERKKQIIIYTPLIYKDVEVMTFKGWRY